MQRRKVLFVAVLLAALCALGMPASLHASVAVNISVFHDQLTPYGRWVVAGSVGNVWVPHVQSGWAPYVDGQWVYTDYGWTWVSYDPWGDAPSHYGAWSWVEPYGWVWTPGTVWAPAWVTWAYSDDFIGWAPLPPSFVFSATGYVGAPIVVATARYCFVPTNQFVGVRVASVRVPVDRNAVIFPRAVKTTGFRVSGGVVRAAGPEPSRIEKVTAHRIAPVSIESAKTRPTTLQQAGVTKASRVSVAAPAAERQRMTAEKAAPKAAERAAPKSAEKAAPKAESSRAAAHPEKSTEAARSSKPSSQSERVAETKPKAAPKPKPESETAPKQSENRSTAHKPAPSHPAPPPQNAHQKKKPESEARPEPSGTVAKSAPPQKKPDQAPGPTEETQVASHAGRPPAQPHAQPAPARPKPAEKKAPPPKEKEPPAGEQKPGD
jgi:hypothetical protein